jgi:hypothetical protein
MLCFTRHTVSPVVCVRWVGHGICRLDVRAVLVRRLGYYCQTAAWYNLYHAHRLMKILKEVEASCLHAIKAAASRYCIIGGAVLLQLVHPAAGWVHIASGRNQQPGIWQPMHGLGVHCVIPVLRVAGSLYIACHGSQLSRASTTRRQS